MMLAQRVKEVSGHLIELQEGMAQRVGIASFFDLI